MLFSFKLYMNVVNYTNGFFNVKPIFLGINVAHDVLSLFIVIEFC